MKKETEHERVRNYFESLIVNDYDALCRLKVTISIYLIKIQFKYFETGKGLELINETEQWLYRLEKEIENKYKLDLSTLIP